MQPGVFKIKEKKKPHGALTPSTGRKGPQDVWGAQVKNTNKGNLLYAVRRQHAKSSHTLKVRWSKTL